MSLNCSASHPTTTTTSYIIVRDTGASWDCSVQTHTQIFDVFGSVGNEVLHNLYCRIKDSRHDELCNSCGIHKKQCRMCNCCCCFIISWMMVAKKKWEQKKVLFPPMQIHIHTSQLHYFSISLFKAKNCVKSRLSFYLYVHTHFNDCNCLPFRWIFLISFTHSSRRYFSSFIINLWFEANWNVDASFNQRFDATSVCFCCRKNCSELKLKVFNLFALITAQKD